MILRAIPATDERKSYFPIVIMAFDPRVLLVRYVIGIFYIDSNMHVCLSYSYQFLTRMPCILTVACWNFNSVCCQWVRYYDHKWIPYNLHPLYIRKIPFTYMWIWLFKSTFILLKYPFIMASKLIFPFLPLNLCIIRSTLVADKIMTLTLTDIRGALLWRHFGNRFHFWSWVIGSTQLELSPK